MPIRGKLGLVGVLVAAAALLTTPGCELFGSISNKDSDLATHKRIWARYNTGTYTYSLQRSCFCWLAGPFKIEVRDNEIVAVTPDPVLSVSEVLPEDFYIFQTVDELFELIEEAYAQGADDVEIEYSNYGYPNSITIDYILNAVDDELYLGVSNMVMALE
jgi:hypothetical protein